MRDFVFLCDDIRNLLATSSLTLFGVAAHMLAQIRNVVDDGDVATILQKPHKAADPVDVIGIASPGSTVPRARAVMVLSA